MGDLRKNMGIWSIELVVPGCSSSLSGKEWRLNLQKVEISPASTVPQKNRSWWTAVITLRSWCTLNKHRYVHPAKEISPVKFANQDPGESSNFGDFWCHSPILIDPERIRTFLRLESVVFRSPPAGSIYISLGRGKTRENRRGMIFAILIKVKSKGIILPMTDPWCWYIC